MKGRSKRRAVGLTMLLTALVLPSAGQAPVSAPVDQWRHFRGSSPLQGVSSSAVPDDLDVLWTYDTGDTIDSSAAIADGRVYVGVGNGDLIALDFESGELAWTHATGSFFGESSPAVEDGVVYIGDLDGVLHAVRADDGEGLWTFQTGSEIKSSPIVAEGLVLMASYDTSLYAVDAKTGELRWSVQTDGMVHATPAVLDGLAFITGCDGMFRALRLEDGSEAYRIVVGSYTAASPMLDGDRAYFGTFDYEVLALDLGRRSILWSYSHPDRAFPFYSSAALAGDLVILGGRDKFVTALRAESGEAAWLFETHARVDSSPVIAGGRVYVGSSDGRLYVLDAMTGEKRWEFNAGAAITASPSIASGRVVVSATDGVVYAFG